MGGSGRGWLWGLDPQSHAPVPEWRDKVQAAMHPVVLDVLAVEATLVPEILLKLLVHVVGNGLPAAGRRCVRLGCEGSTLAPGGVESAWAGSVPPPGLPHHSELFTASPKPGVSTMVSFSLTPFSSMSTVCFRISTVWLMRSAGEEIWLEGASLTPHPLPQATRILSHPSWCFGPDHKA